jgi:hypothetical protein
VEEENYNMFDAFVERISKMRKRDGSPLIQNVENLKSNGCILQINDKELGTQYIRIELDEGNPVEVRDIDGKSF